MECTGHGREMACLCSVSEPQLVGSWSEGGTPTHDFSKWPGLPHNIVAGFHRQASHVRDRGETERRGRSCIIFVIQPQKSQITFAMLDLNLDSQDGHLGPTLLVDQPLGGISHTVKRACGIDKFICKAIFIKHNLLYHLQLNLNGQLDNSMYIVTRCIGTFL